ncbi:MAG: M15 family metallopeptidase [Bacteroidales bacterium]|jgi:D-alanyl-D-alanine dipeptidase|nr:M15 family metallopeptidase [Bacteroidales bacterium]
MKTSQKIAVLVVLAGSLCLLVFWQNKGIKHPTVDDIDTVVVSQPSVQPPEAVRPAPAQGLVRIRDIDSSIIIELKYATADNFTGQALYDDAEAYLQRDVAEMLHTAGAYLQTIRPELRLLVYDAARPLNVQQKMWEKVKDTPYRKYVAHPDRTGLHNYGAAVDITLCSTQGQVLDMGTPFDYFGEAASVAREGDLMKRGKLTARQVENRKLLRQVMRHAGFTGISGEWWHFNACPLAEAKQRYNLIE